MSPVERLQVGDDSRIGERGRRGKGRSGCLKRYGRLWYRARGERARGEYYGGDSDTCKPTCMAEERTGSHDRHLAVCGRKTGEAQGITVWAGAWQDEATWGGADRLHGSRNGICAW